METTEMTDTFKNINTTPHLCRSKVKQTALEIASAIRPANKFSRVGTGFVQRIEASFRAAIREKSGFIPAEARRFYEMSLMLMQTPVTTVTNARSASLHGLPVAPLPFRRRRPFLSANSARSSRAGICRPPPRGGLPVGGSMVVRFVVLGFARLFPMPSLGLPVARPTTEARRRRRRRRQEST